MAYNQRLSYLEETFTLLQKGKLDSFNIRQVCSLLHICHSSFYKVYDSREAFLLDISLYILVNLGITSINDLSNKYKCIIDSIFSGENIIVARNFFSIAKEDEIVLSLTLHLKYKYDYSDQKTLVIKNYLSLLIKIIRNITLSDISKEDAYKCLEQLKDFQ